MSLAKIPFILTAALCHHIAMTPPNPPPSKSEMTGPYGHDNIIGLRIGPYVDKVMVWAVSLCECAAIWAAQADVPPFLHDTVLPRIIFGVSPSAAQHIQITLPYLVGWALVVSGGSIRLDCYRVLGRFFTFELTIREKHKLVTNGPYAFVRHPSYTGAFLVKFGMVMCNLCSASWIVECGIWKNGLGGLGVGEWLIIAWMVWSTYVLAGMALRTAREDEVLQKEFGEQWVQWANRVPYRLIPGLY